MRIAKIIATVIALGGGTAFGQPAAGDFVPPVDIPVILAGNVGEIRPNHFHAGIDIKTEGETGKNILAAADGYVARISIAPGGYGKALYLNHPNGTTTVYAHLDSFEGAIGEYVRSEQYRRRSFAVELYPAAGRLPVRQGEVIARSGNSGSSGGPHLHYEIRDAASQDALNFMGRGWFPGVRDQVAPQFFTLWSVHVDTVLGVPAHRIVEKHTLAKRGEEYVTASGNEVNFVSPGYFALEVVDRKSDAANTMGLYRLEQTVDGLPNFALTTDRLRFAADRDINALVHYALHKKADYEVYRTYVTPNNRLPVYRQVVDRGIVRLPDAAPHRVVIRAEDDSRNVSVIRFTVRESGETFDRSADHPIPVPWNEAFEYTAGGLTVTIPAEVLYESTLFTLAEVARHPAARYSPLYRIASQDSIPLRAAMSVRIRPDSLPERLRPKAALASLGANGRRIYEGGRWSEGAVGGTTRTFGDYFVAVDTVPPRLSPAFRRGADLSGHESAAIALHDDFSGIADWSVEVDGVWTLFDYDAKNNILRHFFRDARFVRGKRHVVKAFAVDNKGNSVSIETEFMW